MDSREREIRNYARQAMWIAFLRRLELAWRLAGGCKPEGARDELGNYVPELLGDFDADPADQRRRLEAARHGDLRERVKEEFSKVPAGRQHPQRALGGPTAVRFNTIGLAGSRPDDGGDDQRAPDRREQ